tara:strand:- start:2573 stop:3910 length:1338 start_codon:yes stop_codon:yes gene_type:complete
MSELSAISPIDGRYKSKVKVLSNFFSEEALMKYRTQVEIEYFISLCKIPLPQLADFDRSLFKKLQEIYKDFSTQDGVEIKKIEKKLNHDVKSVEYFIKEKFKKMDIEKYKEFIHFGLTSQDINNTAIPLSFKEAINKVYLPQLEKLLTKISLLSKEYENIPILARTHGQPASPTRLGKEFMVFIERIKNQKKLLLEIPHAAKFGGATGNFNAHKLAYPKIDWKTFTTNLIETNFGLKYSFPTTQIEHYDSFAAMCDSLRRINTILIDFNRDIWTYISMDYFKQKISTGEVGSSAMPHKINPIDFENSEGNLGIANSTFNFFSTKLPISRLQRDLTDSTVLRNIGVPLSHTLVAFQSTLKGLSKLLVNHEKINQDLENNWAVVAEGIQTILRREGYTNPYESLKFLTRTNKKITKTTISNFIDDLNISSSIKKELKSISPFNYTGI